MNRFRTVSVLLVALVALSGCSRYLPGLFEASPSATATEAPPPTPTPVPLAATVNGEPITLEQFEQEVGRFERARQASGIDLATLGAYREQVLSAMIDLKLLAQGARAQSLSPDPADFEQRYAALTEELGGEAGLNAWLQSQGMSQEQLRTSLEEQALGASMVEQIVGAVPDEVEQVHARHILVASRAEAEGLQAQLASGADFATLANQASLDISTRPAGGDLGWFPAGYLRLPQIEEAAFSLEPGQMSGVVETELGYHLVQTVERGVHRTDADVQRWLREQAVLDWLAQARADAGIELFITP